MRCLFELKQKSDNREHTQLQTQESSALKPELLSCKMICCIRIAGHVCTESKGCVLFVEKNPLGI